MVINAKFKIGEDAYLCTDIEQLRRIVTGITIREGCISYALGYGAGESWHYAFEITAERDIVKATSN